MKGISTILATILIVIIVVALVSLTYTFAVGLFSTSARGATSGTEALTKRLQQSVEFVGASCISTRTPQIKFSIRHSGTVDMIAGDLNALLGGSIVTTLPDIKTQTMTKGQISEFNVTQTVTAGQDVIITASAPAGTVDRTVTCS